MTEYDCFAVVASEHGATEVQQWGFSGSDPREVAEQACQYFTDADWPNSYWLRELRVYPRASVALFEIAKAPQPSKWRIRP